MNNTGKRESLVGILCHANFYPGFSGILKQRFTDFKVNEIDLEGRIARLSKLTFDEPTSQEGDSRGQEAAFAPPASVSQDQPGAPGSTKGLPPDTERSAQHLVHSANPRPDSASADDDAADSSRLQAELDRFAALTGPKDAQQLREFVRAVRDHESAPTECPAPDPIFLEPSEDKEHRRAVHAFFKQHLFSGLLTETRSEKQGSKSDAESAQGSTIRVTYRPPKRRKGGNKSGGKGKGPQEWPTDGSKFVKFALYKENMDTQAAINLLSRYMHLHWSAFGIAGSKDKRGATVQNVTLFKVHPRRLAGLNARLRGLQTGNYSFVKEGLHLGGLSGNLFDIVLREVDGRPADIASAAAALKESGFINYFGLQRFGNEGVPTYETGCLLLRGDWEAAVRHIMQQRPGEREPLPEARRLFLEDADLKASHKLMPPYATAEKAVLQGLLHQGPKSLVGALLQIPRNLRSMYLHAVQSLLWNLAASHRVKEYGIDKVQLGDLVLPPGTPTDAVTGAEVDEVGDEPASLSRLCDVHLVTAEDLAAGLFTIEDVVLPLPGSEVIYPGNSTAEVYEQEAAKCGVSLQSCPHSVREFAISSLPGDYRRLVHRPRDLQWQLLAYSDSNQDLGYTDWDALRGKPRPAADPLDAGAAPPQGKLLALQLSFRLPPSCYATMLIRELMKETTANTQHRERTLASQAPSEAATGVAACQTTSQPLPVQQ